ncbi:cell division protein SepF [Stomatohabitans albus]|uniref:cell division protein SepF n=1 Tax=Stomatohabitans albus TaxID=3110766 RepID=UPI00300DA763
MAINWKQFLYLIGFYNKLEDDDQYADYDDGSELLENWDEPEPQPLPSNVRRLPNAADAHMSAVDHQPVRRQAPQQGQQPPHGRRPVEQRQQPAHVPPTGTVNVISPVGTRPQPQESGPRITDEVAVVAPEVFNDTEEIGEYIRKGRPVLINMQGTDDREARRILDFAAGVCFGLRASFEAGVPRVFLVVPADVKLSNEARQRLHDRGLLA